MKMLRIEAKKEVQDRINAKYASIRERRKGIKVRPNKLMILCLTFEFLNRWVVQAMDSRLASFLSNKFGFSSLSYSFLSCATGVVSCLQQAFLYGYIVRTRGVPIPYVAQFGIVLEMIGYLLMSMPNIVIVMIGTLILVVGYCFATPTSSSIISTTNVPEVQGKVLSWNNSCQQISLIVSPMVLSAIYSVNRDATYYSCMVVSFLAFVVMCFIIAMPNSKQFGKVNVLELPMSDKPSTEMKEDVKSGESKDDEVSKEISECVESIQIVTSAPEGSESVRTTTVELATIPVVGSHPVDSSLQSQQTYVSSVPEASI